MPSRAFSNGRRGAGLFLLLAVSIGPGSRHAVPAAGRDEQRDCYNARTPGYNGLFTFTRIRYNGTGRRFGGGSWAHDWPDGDCNISFIMRELTGLRATVDGTNVYTLEDPEIFRHPIIYVSEPGYWYMTSGEEDALRTYLERGGFVIFDDYEDTGRQFENLLGNLERVLPGFELIEVGPEHPIFNTFFRIENLYIPHPLVRVTPKYYAIFEDNDPNGRMLAILNHNNDLAEYWEFSGRGFFPVDLTNEAYKIGINEIFYALTH